MSTRAFGMIDTAAILGGALQPIATHGTAVAVLMAYASVANGDGLAWLGERKLASVTGTHEVSVRRARKACVKAGLLQDTGTHRDRCKVFRVMVTPSVCAMGEAGDTERKRYTSADAHVASAQSTRSVAVRDTERRRTPNRQNREEQQQQQTAAPAPAAAGGDPIEAALIAGGIGEPKLSDLTARCRAEGVTASAIRHQIEQAHERGKGAGALIRNIESQCDRAKQAAHDAKAKRKHTVTTTDANASELQAIFENMSESESTSIGAEAWERLRPSQRRDLKSVDPDRRAMAAQQLTIETLLLARQYVARRDTRPPPPRRQSRSRSLAAAAAAG